jgi:RNA polymerase sigma-70 factor, ECF subfamily
MHRGTVAQTVDQSDRTGTLPVMSLHLEAFLSALDDRRSEIPEELASALEQIVQHARGAWPQLDVPAEVFMGRIAAVIVREASDLLGTLHGLHTGDLYLTAGCLLGRPAAVTAFENHHLSSVGGLIKHLDATPVFADEVRQELRRKFFVAEPPTLPKLASYTGRGPLGSWVAVAAQRAALDVLRRWNRERPTDDQVLENLLSGGLNPELLLAKAHLKHEVQQALRSALKSLPVRERIVLRLALVTGLTLDEVGTIYKVNASTISRWLCRSRRNILAAMEEFLMERAGASPSDLQSMVALVRSQVDVGLSSLLGDYATDDHVAG